MHLISGEMSASCSCDVGYEGERCETNVNECKSNPCKNNATCEDGINSFRCRCLPGNKGKYCEEGNISKLGRLFVNFCLELVKLSAS